MKHPKFWPLDFELLLFSQPYRVAILCGNTKTRLQTNLERHLNYISELWDSGMTKAWCQGFVTKCLPAFSRKKRNSQM